MPPSLTRCFRCSISWIDDVFDGLAGYGEVVEYAADNDGAMSGRSGR